MTAMSLARVTLGLAERTSRALRSLGLGKTVALILLFAVPLCDAPAAPAQFKQLGPRLVGAGSVGNAIQGFSVALSADGSTAAVLNDRRVRACVARSKSAAAFEPLWRVFERRLISY